MQWYYSKNASQLGPVPLEELCAKIASGEVTGADMAWTEGMPDWRPISSIPELHVVQQANKPAPSQPGGAAASPYAPARTSGLAIASLVCGIAGITCMFLPGIAAVICGHMALRQIADPNVRMEGRGMAIAGLVLGYLSVAIMALWLLVVIVGFAANGPL
jgi:hypothetical protein